MLSLGQQLAHQVVALEFAVTQLPAKIFVSRLSANSEPAFVSRHMPDEHEILNTNPFRVKIPDCSRMLPQHTLHSSSLGSPLLFAHPRQFILSFLFHVRVDSLYVVTD